MKKTIILLLGVLALALCSGVSALTDVNVTLLYPLNFTTIDWNRNITYNVTGGMNNCTLWTNATSSWNANQTGYGIAANINQTFNITQFPDGTYNWSVQCVNLTNSYWSQNNWTFTLDYTHVNVTLLYPLDGTTVDGSRNFTYNVTEGMNNCTLWTNASTGLWNANQTGYGIEKSINYTFNMTQFPDGTYNWSVKCYNKTNVYWPKSNWTFTLGLTPVIGITRVEPFINDNRSNATYFNWFNVTVNVTCYYTDCGTMNVSLDPKKKVKDNLITPVDPDYVMGETEIITPVECSNHRNKQLYEVVEKSGEEGEYDIEMDGTQICAILKDRHIITSKDKIKFRVNKKVDKNITKLDNMYCYNANPIVDYEIKIGDNSIELILMQDAWLLDSNRNVIENITYEMKEDDYITKTIQEGQYVRIKFEQQLTKGRIINVHLRNITEEFIGREIELYKKDSDVLISTDYINRTSYRYINLLVDIPANETEDEFDLKIVGGNITIDYIVDPQCQGPNIGEDPADPDLMCLSLCDETDCICYLSFFGGYLTCGGTTGSCASGGACTIAENPITNCLYIDTDNEEYTLTQDITNSGVTVCVDVNANNVTLDCDGYVIDGIDKSGSKAINIRSNKDNVTIKNCIINDWYYGIYGASNTDTDLINNTLTSNRYMPLHMRYQQNVLFENNTVTDNYNYVYFYQSNNGIIQTNKIIASYYGLINYDSSAGTYRNNRILGNNITANYPLYWAYIYNNTYQDNYLYSTYRTMYGASNSIFNVTFYNNYVSCAGATCLYLRTNPTNPTVFNRSYAVATNIMGGANVGGNYWTNPSKTGFSDKCADADKDGICDDSYLITNAYSGGTYRDYLPISNVSITLSQTISTPANNSILGQSPSIIVNVKANVGWNDTEMFYSNSTLPWNKMINCTNESINGLVNINYICKWNNTNLTTGASYDILISTTDKSNNIVNSSANYSVDLTLPQTTYIESDFPEYPFSRFRPSVDTGFTAIHRLSNLDENNSNIKGYYNFDTDVDSGEDKINVNNGTFKNGLGITEGGYWGNSLDLDGIDDYMDLGNSTEFDFINNFTLSAYVKTTEEGYVIVKDPEGGYVYQDVAGTLRGTNIGWNYMMGYHFQPTETGASVTELCGYFSGTKTVKLQDNAFTVIASVSVTSSNAWACESITPVALTKDADYYVGAPMAGSGASYDQFSSPRISHGINIIKSIYQSGATQFSYASGSTYYFYGKADIKVSYGKGGDLPYSLSTHTGGRFEIINNSVSYTVMSPVNASDGNWHLLTATYGNGNMSLYVDGALVNSSSAFNGTIPENDLPVWVGRSYNPSDATDYFDGQIDDVMISNITLNHTDVLKLNSTMYERFAKMQDVQLEQNLTVGVDLIKVRTYFHSYNNTKVNLSLGYYDGSWYYFNSTEITSGINQEYTVTTTASNLSLNYTLMGEGGYTPEIYDNVSIDSSSTSSARQTSIRNSQTIVLRVNVSDADSGIANVTINSTYVNDTESVNMTLQSGSVAANQWGYFNATIVDVNSSEGNVYPPVYAYDTANNMRGSDTFSIFFDNTPTNVTYITNLTSNLLVKGDDISISWSILDSSPLSPNGYYILSNNISAILNNNSQGYLNEDGNGEVSFENLQVGNYSYQLYTFDDSGNPYNTSVFVFGVVESPPVEIVVIYPNNNSVLTVRNQSVGFQALYVEPDNCSLYYNNLYIDNRNDTNESNIDYYFANATLEYDDNVVRVDCFKDSTKYSSADVFVNVTKYVLGINLTEPTANFSIEQNQSFNWIVNVSCWSANCSVTNVTLNYNHSYFSLNTTFMQNVTMTINESYIISWNVTANGSVGSYNFSSQIKNVDYYQELEDYENITSTILVNVTAATATKSGLISNVSGTLPFYVNYTNPQNISLDVGESMLVTWYVNATGAVGNTYEFFAYVNQTANLEVMNYTTKWNVTISLAGGAADPCDCDGTEDCTIDCSSCANTDSWGTYDIRPWNFTTYNQGTIVTNNVITAGNWWNNRTGAGNCTLWINGSGGLDVR